MHRRTTNLRLRASESNWLGKLFGGKSDHRKEQMQPSDPVVLQETTAVIDDDGPDVAEERREDLDESPLTAEELKTLSFEKYGHSYDMAIVKRVIMGKKLVFLNILHKYLGQKSFTMTEEEYLDKLSAVAAFINAADEQGKVRKELAGPMKGKNGMPRRPVVGTAVSLSLNVPDEVLESWGM